jgi:hypothetical protein
VDWIGLAQDRNRWKALVNSVLNLRVPWNAGKLSSGLASSGLWSSAQLELVSYKLWGFCGRECSDYAYVGFNTMYIVVLHQQEFQRNLLFPTSWSKWECLPPLLVWTGIWLLFPSRGSEWHLPFALPI